MRKKLPIGISDFREIIEQDYAFVDKSLLIREVLDASGKALLLPRPRRFGKTLNMQMLEHFFRESEEDTSHLFANLAAAQYPEVMAQQGTYPVLSLSLKGVKAKTWESAYIKLGRLVADQCQAHSSIAASLNAYEGRIFSELMVAESDQADLEGSLRDLVVWLARHHGQPVILLIDEYDTPILEACSNGYYDEMVSFMRSWLGEGLKLEAEPQALFKAVVTGIMRVAKESLFSGLNNLSVCPVQETGPFEDQFGFTQAEVESLLADYGLSEKLSEVQDWYNGYRFGNSTIYNPWSIIQYIDKQPSPAKPHWLNTSSNDLVYEVIREADAALRRDLEALMVGESITHEVTEAAVLREGAARKDIWSYLLAAGYLTAANPRWYRNRLVYDLTIPNLEIESLYADTISSWLHHVQFRSTDELLDALLDGNWPRFESLLGQLVLTLLSYHDLGADKPAEAVIQAFVLGLLANLTGTHQIRSNREEGEGRADIVLNPFDKAERGIVIEFKAIETEADVEQALAAALAQVEEKQYAAGLEADGVKDISRLGIVLQGKTVKVRAG